MCICRVTFTILVCCVLLVLGTAYVYDSCVVVAARTNRLVCEHSLCVACVRLCIASQRWGHCVSWCRSGLVYIGQHSVLHVRAPRVEV